MKKLIIPALAMAMLSSCGGSGSQTSQEQTTDSTLSAAQQTPIEATELTDNEVNEIYKLIPAKYKDSKKKFSKLEKENSRFYYAQKQRKNWEDDDYSESITLFPMNDGGWKVVFCSEHCWEGCGSEYHSFTYKDGQLKEDSKLIYPMDAPESFVVEPFCIYNAEDEMEAIKRDASQYYSYSYRNDTLFCSFGPDGHESTLYDAFGSASYLWNGNDFVKVKKQDEEPSMLIMISNEGLGGVRLGNKLDKKICDFDCKDDGDGYYSYSRKGKKFFSVHLGDEKEIDEILVFSDIFCQANWIQVGDSITKVTSMDHEAYMIPSEDGAYVSITNYNNDNWIGYNATGKDGIIESIRIYKNYWAEATATENFYMQAMNVGGYSAFTTDPFDDFTWESDEDYPNVVRDNRHSRYAEEYFEFVSLKKGYYRYGIMCYSTSFQGEDEPEGTYCRGVDVYTFDYRGATEVGKGISSDDIAKEYNVEPYLVNFKVTVDGYITMTIEDSDIEAHYEINDKGEIVKQ